MAKLNEQSTELILPNFEECAKLYFEWRMNVKNNIKNYTSFNVHKARDTLIKALTSSKNVKRGGKIKTKQKSGQTITLQSFIILDDNIWQLLTSTKKVRI